MDEQLTKLIFLIWINLGISCWFTMLIMDALRGIRTGPLTLIEVLLRCIAFGPFTWLMFIRYLLLLKEQKDEGQS